MSLLDVERAEDIADPFVEEPAAPIERIPFRDVSPHMTPGDVVVLFRGTIDRSGILVQIRYRDRHLVAVADILGVTKGNRTFRVRPEHMYVRAFTGAVVQGESFPGTYRTTLARAKARSVDGEERWVVIPSTGEMLRVATLYDLWLLEHPYCNALTELRAYYKLVNGVEWMNGEGAGA